MAHACMLGGGGEGCQVNTEDVDPRVDVPADLVELSDGESVWVTRWDNPPVTGLVDMATFQTTERAGREWLWVDLDLAVTVQPPVANPGQFSPFEETRAVSAWPSLAGDFDPGSLLFWEAHGLLLQPRITGAEFEAIAMVQSLRTDRFLGPADTADFFNPVPYDNYDKHKRPGRFQLAADVALVPLKLLVLYIPGHASFGANWLSTRYLAALFDDIWTERKEIRPIGFGYWGAFGEWALGCDDCGGPNNVQPDRIWDECGVQFRAVKYHQCPVSEAVFYAQFQHLDLMINPCDVNGMHSSVVAAVEDCTGFDIGDGLPAVVFKGDLVFENQFCNGQFGTPGFTPLIGEFRWPYIRRFGGNLIVAHELGHLLGLPDTENSCSEPKTLMCSEDPQPLIDRPDDNIQVCASAATTARNQQDAFWR